VVVGWGEWLFEPIGEGRTRFTWKEEIRMRSPVPGEIALRLYGPIQRWMLRRSLGNLTRVLAPPD
jgi:hypothetical protein